VPDLKDDLAALRLPREPESSGRRWGAMAALLLVIAAGTAGAWWWTTREQPLEVDVASVTARADGVQAAVLNASGYVTARRRATVSSKITGKIVELHVEEGMAVREGQILARLDDVTLRAALALSEAQAEAARRAVQETEVRLREARLTLARQTQLVDEGIATRAAFDAAEADVASLEARLAAEQERVRVAERQVALERTNLENTIIRAPFSGVAISKDAQPGEMVSPVSAGGGFTRTGICTIVDMNSLEIEVDVSENYINRVRPGQPVKAILNAYPDWEIPAHVITTVPAADRQKATVLVRIGFDELDPRILPDMGVKVTFLREEDDNGGRAAAAVPLVPKSAVVGTGDDRHVFVVREGRAERRAIRVGGEDGDRLAVLAGLEPGEQVVVSPPPDLASGARVVAR
jgi:RND family efflux transporter MFP subunit